MMPRLFGRCWQVNTTAMRTVSRVKTYLHRGKEKLPQELERGDWIYQELGTLAAMLAGIHAAEAQHLWQGILQNLSSLQKLKIRLDLWWGVIVGPLFGLTSVYIVLCGVNGTKPMFRLK